MTVGIEKPLHIADSILYGGCESITETLLGHVGHWNQLDALLSSVRMRLITELTPFRFPMTCDDENVAKCFGLEIARLLLDVSFRDFQMARYESEKRMIQQNRRRR